MVRWTEEKFEYNSKLSTTSPQNYVIYGQDILHPSWTELFMLFISIPVSCDISTDCATQCLIVSDGVLSVWLCGGWAVLSSVEMGGAITILCNSS